MALAGGRLYLARIALLGGTALLLLLVGELAARVVLRQEVRDEEALDPSLRRVEGVEALKQPSWQGVYKGVLHRSNSQSVRGPEYPNKAAPGVFRIAITGDSVAMGQGVRESATYAKALESLLSEAQAGQRFEVLNFGQSALNTAKAVARIKKLSRVYDFDLAIYGFTINDIEGRYYEEADGEWAPARQMRTRLKWRRSSRFEDSPFYLLRWIWPRWVLLRGFDDMEIGLEDEILERNYFRNPQAWGDLDAALKRLAAFGRTKGRCTAVFLHTHLTELTERHPYLRIYEHVSRAAAEHGLFVIESFSTFAGQNEMALWVSRTDSHPNERGHALLADALHEGLARLPERCWRR